MKQGLGPRVLLDRLVEGFKNKTIVVALGKLRYESKYLAIQYFHRERQWNISWMCRKLEITRAAYYKWLHSEVPEQEKENIQLAELIREYDECYGHILGYRRMTAWINHFNGTHYSKNRMNQNFHADNVSVELTCV